MSNLISSIEKFFVSENLKKFNNACFFLCRTDGILIYKYIPSGFSGDPNSFGALIGGVWQASKALSSYIPEEKGPEIFRLSFDTISRGVYILPINCDGNEYYFASIYNDEINPGQLKNKIRKILLNLESYLDDNSVKNELLTDSNYLFRDITDEEMDQLFNFK
jgi:hypothetical protein